MCRWRQEAAGRPGHPRPSRVPGGARALLRPEEDRPWGQRRGDGVAAGGGVPAPADRMSSSRRCLGEVTPLTPLLPGRRRPPPRFHRKPLRNPPSVLGGLGPPFRRLIAAGEYLPGRLAGGQLWVMTGRTAVSLFLEVGGVPLRSSRVVGDSVEGSPSRLVCRPGRCPRPRGFRAGERQASSVPGSGVAPCIPLVLARTLGNGLRPCPAPSRARL